MGKGQKPPQRLQSTAFLHLGENEIDRHGGKIGGEYAQRPVQVEVLEPDVAVAVDIGEQLVADQIAAEHEEQIHAGPAEAADDIEPGRPQNVWNAVVDLIME